MIQAIIFDCFGVLTSETFYAFLDKYLKDPGLKRAQANEAMDNLNAGLSTRDKFYSTLAKLSGLTETEVINFMSSIRPNEKLFDYIRQNLKPKYKLGVLSNVGDNRLDALFGKENLELFDDAVLSFAHGVIKPSKEIFIIAANRLNVAPEDCIFVDDRQKHVNGAVAAGMQAILYQDFDQFRTELEKLLADPDR